MTAVGRYVYRLVEGFARGWNDFWYTPVDPTLLGLVRILTGMVLLYDHAIWGVVLKDFFGPESWINRDLVDFVLKDQYTYTFWWSIPPRWIWLAYAFSMTVIFWFTIGLWTRVSSILSVVVLISFAHRVPEALFGLDKVIGMLTFYLALGPSGRALSVDSWLERRRAKMPGGESRSVAANFALRLIQIHMCIIYLVAGASKLQGAAWWNGQAMWMAFANLEYQSVDMTWTAWYPWSVELLSHFTVFWELSFCVLIWVKVLRPLVLFGAVVLHVGIGATMGLWTFSLVMLIGCASFLPPDGVAALFGVLAPSRQEKATTAKRAGARQRRLRAGRRRGGSREVSRDERQQLGSEHTLFCLADAPDCEQLSGRAGAALAELIERAVPEDAYRAELPAPSTWPARQSPQRLPHSVVAIRDSCAWRAAVDRLGLCGICVTRRAPTIPAGPGRGCA